MKNISGQDTLESMSQAIWYNQWTLKKFSPYLVGEILEVGCGIGNFTDSLTKYGNVWAVDINKEYIIETKQLVSDRAQVGFGDIEKGKYFFGSQKFDNIVCLNVLEHIDDDYQAIKNLHKLLKDKGYLILLVPIHPFLYGRIDQTIGHFRRYTSKRIINKLRKANFNILKTRRLNFLGAIGWYIAGCILGKNKVEERQVKTFNILAPLALSLEDLIEPPIGTSLLIITQK